MSLKYKNNKNEEIEIKKVDAGDDFVLPFKIDRLPIRGRLVRLGTAAHEIIQKHDYPPAIGELLGQSLALTSALASTLKYEGIFTLQSKTDGVVKMLVSDLTSEGHLRGYCSFDPGAVEAAESGPKNLIGGGYLAFTVDHGRDNEERYQGIVELKDNNLIDSVQNYLSQSEQLSAHLKAAALQVKGLSGIPHWRAGAIIVNRLPLEEWDENLSEEQLDDGWNRIQFLLNTCTSAELTDPILSPEELLFRLFHEDGVRVFRPQKLAARCRCSRPRIHGVLQGLSKDDLQDMVVDGKITVTCQFCNHSEIFTLKDLEPSPAQG